jgi:polyvinyl alcohol dehydrogenase (cytochrome)
MNSASFRPCLRILLRAQRYGVACGALLATLGLLVTHPTPAGAEDWPMFGQNPQNTASQSNEATISPSNVAQLSVKWSYTTMGDVSARAAVVGGVVYFPDWGGYLHALNASTGQLIWSRQLSAYGSDLAPNTNSRTTPAVVNGTLYLGTQEGAWLLAINAATGALLWKTQLESPGNDPFAIISASPTVVGGTVYRVSPQPRRVWLDLYPATRAARREAVS